jgi:DNA-binding GntR family transcriptional regulator
MIKNSTAHAANGPTSCREVVRRALLERIGDGVLVPGERIVEARLAEEFGVSAIPVREAIRELVSMGVLAAANNKGAWVREVGMGETADALEVKAALESQAARSGSGPWRGDGLELKRLCTSIARAAKRRNFAEYQRLNHSFHRMIVAAAGNATLLRLWDGLAFEVRTRPILEFLSVEDPLTVAREHEAIAAALLAGRRRRAAALLAAHAGRLVAHLRRGIAEAPAASITDKGGGHRAA